MSWGRVSICYWFLEAAWSSLWPVAGDGRYSYMFDGKRYVAVAAGSNINAVAIQE